MRTFLLLIILLCSSSGALAGSRLLVIGDSLSAGYGLRPEQAWPSLLASRLTREHRDYTVANLSISGETSAGGRSRLAAALREHKPAVVIIELGANDGLRGLPLTQMRDNLEAMITTSQAAGARVLLIGMRLPPNYGPYADDFARSYRELASTKRVALLDFLLEPIAGRSDAFQSDNLHPTAAVQPLILDHVWKALLPLLK